MNLLGRRAVSEKVAAIFDLTRGGWVPVNAQIEREEKGGGG